MPDFDQYYGMKVYVGGAKFLQGQTQRIERGLVELGHEITPHMQEADLIYVNNAWYDEVIEAKKQGLKGKFIFNVLDLAPHLPDFPLDRLKEQLAHADGICTISQFVHDDLLKRTGYESSVIYQPIKDIDYNRTPKILYKFLFVGRVQDPNKRATLGAQAVGALGGGANDVLTVGGDAPPYGGKYAGIVSDTILNDIYNASDYLMACSKSEGLFLPPQEAIAADCIPVICNDLNVREEFFPTNLFPEYAAIDPNPQSIAAFIAALEKDQDKKREFITRLRNHYRSNWEAHLSGLGVAKKIISVYEGLIKKDLETVL